MRGYNKAKKKAERDWVRLEQRIQVKYASHELVILRRIRLAAWHATLKFWKRGLTAEVLQEQLKQNMIRCVERSFVHQGLYEGH